MIYFHNFNVFRLLFDSVIRPVDSILSRYFDELLALAQTSMKTPRYFGAALQMIKVPKFKCERYRAFSSLGTLKQHRVPEKKRRLIVHPFEKHQFVFRWSLPFAVLLFPFNSLAVFINERAQKLRCNDDLLVHRKSSHGVLFIKANEHRSTSDVIRSSDDGVNEKKRRRRGEVDGESGQQTTENRMTYDCVCNARMPFAPENRPSEDEIRTRIRSNVASSAHSAVVAAKTDWHFNVIFTFHRRRR